MVYLKPPARVTKIFNKLAMVTTPWDVHTLEVARRNAVNPQRIPVIPLEYDGSLFVVSTRGESEWVKNVRAAGTVRLGQKGHFETFATTEVPAEACTEILAAYRSKTGREVAGYWKRLPASASHPTFKLTPTKLTPTLPQN
ncbi:MAG TPA: nitroreductase/quinone reductase family protein [Dermatophilaceae bacterium]